MEQNTTATIHVATTSPAASAPSIGLQETSRDILAKKYLMPHESGADDTFERVSTKLANAEAPELREAIQAEFRRAFDAGFVAGGRIMSGAGRDAANVTLINCFVQPIGDCMTGRDEEGLPGIMDALAQAAETMRRGGGVGYNFSRIRPAGAWVRGTQSTASGPCPYIDTFDAMCATVESAGSRRGAQMGVLDVSHPDIEAFVEAKKVQSRWRNFNVSVRTSDAFHAAVDTDAEWQLVHRAQPHPATRPEAFQREDGLWVYKTIRARDLWDRITRMTYDYAEPGIIFGDRVSTENNLWYCESLDASNPCAEQVLPPYGCCCIGSLNLTRFVRNPFTAYASFDFIAFAETVGPAVRALDNVLDVTAWPLPQQHQEAMNKRRIGLGFFGLGSAKFMLGLRYGSDDSVRFAEAVSKWLRNAAYKASIELAKEKGPFPLLDREKYLESGFAQRLPDEIREDILRYGIRNSHLLSIAPTGTMALSFGDNASNGLEPAFAVSYQRRVRQPDNSERIVDVEDHAYRLFRASGGDVSNLPAHWVTTQDLTVEDHLRVMAAIVPYIDASISKTVNCPESMSFEDFGDVYLRAYELGLKSCATYRPSGVRGSILIDPNAAKAAERTDDPDRRLVLKPAAGLTEGSLRWPRRPDSPDGSPSWTFRVNAPEARFAITVAHYENGTNHPFEVWAQGAEVPRVLPAIAKVLSADMRT
ncbi:adenosylcobalamin-dependent ribonucleoside-diphosphate reductase, partial [Aquimonas sp.]|uniref:adenosylcobalamin-dependent ribonucleoside-diphosphate reductase n=1 Tax=Aquimonas sp. TaxID=1872588 RepID=UPI0037BF6999